MRTRNYLFIFSLLLLTALPIWADSIIFNFSAQVSDGDFVVLEWNSGSESGLQVYRVERSLDGLNFQSIAEMAPLGSNSVYRYEDHDIYKSTSRTYYYRIRAQMGSGVSSLSSVQSVVLDFSGIQQTWGSIKALFR